MPTYDYECGACGHAFEHYQSITSPAIRKCPSCKKSKVKRLIGTGAGIIFKGSGFYQTDYRSDSYKASAKADSDKASAKPADASNAGETKAASSAESKTVDSKPANNTSGKKKAGGKD